MLDCSSFLKIAVPKRKRSVSRKKIINYCFYKISTSKLNFKSVWKNVDNTRKQAYSRYFKQYNINFYYHDAYSFE